MAQIEVSEKIFKEFQRLKEELKNIYSGQELSNDQIMEAMVGGFFDSLEYMKKEHEHGHDHDHDCCGGKGDCKNKDKGDCCGQHHHHY